MKRLLLFLMSTLLLWPGIEAQDVITKTDGTQIKGFVKEVTLDLIRYKKYSNPNGPLYTLDKTDVSTISYENGEKDIFNAIGIKTLVQENLPLTTNNGFWGLTIRKGNRKLSARDVKNIFNDHPLPLSLFKSGKTMNAISNIIAIPSALLVGSCFGVMLSGEDVNGATFALSGAGLIAAICLNVAGTNKIKKSVRIYNDQIRHSTSLNFQFGIHQYGLGVSLCLYN